MFDESKIAVTKRGNGYVLGWTSNLCGVWKIGSVTGIPDYTYPPTPSGWKNACSKFEELEEVITHYTSISKQQITLEENPIGAPSQVVDKGQLGYENSYQASALQNTQGSLHASPISDGGVNVSGVTPEAVTAQTQTSAAADFFAAQQTNPQIPTAPTISSGYFSGDLSTSSLHGERSEQSRQDRTSGSLPQVSAVASSIRKAQIVGASLLLVGLIVGVIGLFSTYLGQETLISSGSNLATHIFYLAAWAIGAILILTSDSLSSYGAMFALGASLISFGLFVTDIASGVNASYIGPGLALSAASWLLCTGGAAISYFFARKTRETKFHTATPFMVISAILVLAIAILYIPSWDSYTIMKLTTGVSSTYTAGDAFQAPAPLIAGSLATAIGFAIVGLYATVFSKTRKGYVFFAGAFAVMLSQVVSAYVQQDNPYSATGISKSAAQLSGVHVTAGFTPMFYGFVVCLIVLAAFVISGITSVSNGSLGSHLAPIDTTEIPVAQTKTQFTPAGDNPYNNYPYEIRNNNYDR